MKPCRFFNTPQGCPKGLECPFMHQKMKHRRCRFFSSPSGCPYGLVCSFNHEPVLLEKQKKPKVEESEGKKKKEIQESNYFCPVCKATFKEWEEAKTHFEESAHLGAHCTQCGRSFQVIHFRNLHETETSHDSFKGVLVQIAHLKEVPKELIKKLKKFTNHPRDLIESFYSGYDLNVTNLNEEYVISCLNYFVNENIYKGVVKILGIKLLLFLEESKVELKHHEKIKILIQQSLKQNQDLQFIFQMIYLYKLDRESMLKDLNSFKMEKLDLKELELKLDESILNSKVIPSESVTLMIENLYEKEKPTKEDFSKRKEAFKIVKSMVEEIWKDATLEIFGSTKLEIFTSSSDVDVCVMLPDKYLMTEKYTLIEIKKKLTQKEIDSSLVLKTRVPVLSFMINEIKFDVVVNQEINIKKTQLILEYIQMDYRVAPLLFSLKKWKRSVEEKFMTNEVLISEDGSLNLSYHLSRGLTFYCLTLMMIFYLQNRPIKILSNLQSTTEDAMLEDNKESLGELLLGFFKEYSYFGFSSFVVSIRTGKPLEREESSMKNHSVSVEDPYEIDINAARHLSKKKLCIEFKKAFLHLCENK
jgi:predicted nucleotidyltransferase